MRLVDVTADTPHVKDIRWLVDSGISTGWRCRVCAGSEAEFRGDSPVTRQDMAAFLHRMSTNVLK